jgi:group II intron reverse transcriptase/maturase
MPDGHIGTIHEGNNRTVNMYVDEKSDKIIVPQKQSNKGKSFLAETVEGRILPKGNTGQTAAVRTQGRGTASSGLAGVRQVAQRERDVQFTALLHHITVVLLEQSYFALKRKSAPGIDGVTWQSYGENLTEKLTALHDQIHRGSYRAQPARRTMIPKADGTERPLSILCLEDKIVQQAVVYVLEAIYEPDFMGFSYGFRRGRGQHDALDALSVGLQRKRVNWVLDADIQRFFDAMNHEWMLRFLQHRIGDKRLLRLIVKWLKVGVMNEQHIERSQVGAPQGAVISPILANVYLHYAFDLWANQWRRRNATGDVIIIRYADDSVFGFEYEHEAQQFLRDLQERLKGFGLTLHPEKTRLIRFGRTAARDRKKLGLGKPEVFDFLGFTHFCSQGKRSGSFVVGRKTNKKRMRATLQLIKLELRRRLHDTIALTGKWLSKVLTGHMNYFSVPGNYPSLWAFFTEVRNYWLRSLRRRSQKAFISWGQFVERTDRFIPKIRILHPQPFRRFNVRTQRRSPVR